MTRSSQRDATDAASTVRTFAFHRPLPPGAEQHPSFGQWCNNEPLPRPSASSTTRTARIFRTLSLASLALAGVVAFAACGLSSGTATGELGDVQSRAAACPKSPLLSIIDKDVSASQDDPAIQSASFGVIEAEIGQAVACAAVNGRGHVTVRLFATNESQTATLLDQDITVPGATKIARERKVVRDQTAEGLSGQAQAAYPQAVAALPHHGSDVLSQFPLAAETFQQVEQATGTEWALALTVITDGFATTPTTLRTLTTTAGAEALAQQARTTNPPGLGGSDQAWRISLAGIGRTTGKQPASQRIEAVKAFWRTYLDGTATQLTVATDFPSTDTFNPTTSASASPAAFSPATSTPTPTPTPTPPLASGVGR